VSKIKFALFFLIVIFMLTCANDPAVFQSGQSDSSAVDRESVPPDSIALEELNAAIARAKTAQQQAIDINSEFFFPLDWQIITTYFFITEQEISTGTLRETQETTARFYAMAAAIEALNIKTHVVYEAYIKNDGPEIALNSGSRFEITSASQASGDNRPGILAPQVIQTATPQVTPQVTPQPTPQVTEPAPQETPQETQPEITKPIETQPVITEPTPQVTPQETQPVITQPTPQVTPQETPQETQPVIAQPTPQVTPQETQPETEPTTPQVIPQETQQIAQPTIPDTTPAAQPMIPQTTQPVQPTTPQVTPQEPQQIAQPTIPDTTPAAQPMIPQTTQPVLPTTPQVTPQEPQPVEPSTTPATQLATPQVTPQEPQPVEPSTTPATQLATPQVTPQPTQPEQPTTPQVIPQVTPQVIPQTVPQETTILATEFPEPLIPQAKVLDVSAVITGISDADNKDNVLKTPNQIIEQEIVFIAMETSIENNETETNEFLFITNEIISEVQVPQAASVYIPNIPEETIEITGLRENQQTEPAIRPLINDDKEDEKQISVQEAAISTINPEIASPGINIYSIIFISLISIIAVSVIVFVVIIKTRRSIKSLKNLFLVLQLFKFRKFF